MNFFKYAACALSFSYATSHASCAQNNPQLRVAVDIGAGKLKMQAALVDDKAKTICKTILSKKTPIPIRESVLRSPTNSVPHSVQISLQNEIKQFIQDTKNIAPNQEFQIVATATEGLRSADNHADVLRNLESEIPMKCFCLSQDMEALQGHLTLQAENILKDIPPDGYFVFENGNGSCQISTKDKNGVLHCCHHRIGKIFAKETLDSIRSDPLAPLTKKELSDALRLIKEKLKHTEDEYFSNQITKSEITVFGIGAMFSSVKKSLKAEVFTKEDLVLYINKCIKKKKNFSNPDRVSDLLFCLAIMEFLHIQKVCIPTLQGKGTTSGILIDSTKWN